MRYFTFLVLLLLNVILVTKSHLDLDWTRGSIKNRLTRDISCRENLEYAHENLCCLNCPAGTYMKSACLRDSEKGVCEPCEFDTFTEHTNGLKKCLSCTKCRLDQDTVEKCTSTQNTRCVCKQGSFCLPDQACEVCKKCSKCKDDEVLVERCTVSSNTVCKKRMSLGRSLSVIFLFVLPLIGMLVCVVSGIYWKKTKLSKNTINSRSPTEMVKICMGERDDLREERQNTQNSKLDDQPFLELNQVVGIRTSGFSEVERDRGLGDSLPNTANSSQNSLDESALHSNPQPNCADQPLSSTLTQHFCTLECGLSRRLIPLNGEESLKKTFDFFEEIDIHYHNRFFRFIGLNDNAIKMAESLFPDDRVYELLKIWMEREGMKADFNILIEALIYLDQRLSAENIIVKAIGNGLFKYEDE